MINKVGKHDFPFGSSAAENLGIILTDFFDAYEENHNLLSKDEFYLITTSFKSVREQIAIASLVRELKRLWEE